MPIVLAIEPDRRQAAHLSAIVRHQVGADLVIADTTEAALYAIGDRVPDLVLVPALLSPQDDAALAAALRVIAVAAHVRTLTVPVLSSGVARAQNGGGMLARWRKNKSASPEPDGCEPAVFGEQIAAYLKEVAAERAQIADDLLGDEPAPEPYVEPAPEPLPVYAAVHYTEPVADAVPIAAYQPFVADQREYETPALAAAAEALSLDDEQSMALEDDRSIDLSDELAGLSSDGDADAELFDGEAVGVYTIPAEVEAPAFEPFDLLHDILEPSASAEPIAAVAEYAARAATAVPAARVDAEPEPFVFEAPPRADVEPWVPMYLTPGRMWPALEGVPAEMPVARTEQPDWIELVASLRQDLERKRTDPAAATADPIAARPSDGATAAVRPLAKKPKLTAKQPKPVQDEWGFFDPEQCGFSTLLAKLDEITDDAARG
jgi:hypothetical protein